jgi:polyisoprenoid-binding protein YceI
MLKKVLWVLGIIALLAIGGVVYLYFAGGSGEPSAELTTPTIAGDTDSSTSTAEGVTPFVIDPTRSTSSFEIDEVLRGSPNHVVGITSEVAGQVALDPSDPSTAQFSQIVINARTLKTDSERRDRAMRGPIVLNSASDEFELITFDVTSVDGLPESMEAGEQADFTVTGDLTIKGTTSPVTFQVAATLSDASTIEGSATAIVTRTDFGIGIPNAPGVASVADEVTLVLDFVAASG